MTILPHLVIDGTALDGRQLELHYDMVLVGLSYVLAVFASYVTLRLVGHLRTTEDARRQHLLIAIAGLMLGGGIWAMHFTGMLAAKYPVEVRYDPTLTPLADHPDRYLCVRRFLYSRIRNQSAPFAGERRRHGSRHLGHALRRDGRDARARKYGLSRRPVPPFHCDRRRCSDGSVLVRQTI